MEEVYMIPQKDMEELIQHYKGELTENALLTKAAKIAAKKHVLLKSGLPPAIINAKTKPMSNELVHLTKWTRQFPGGSGSGGQGEHQEDEEEGDLVAGPVEQWLKQMIKGSPSTPKLPIGLNKDTVATTSRIPVRIKEEALADIKKRRKTLEKKIGGTVKGKGKGKGKSGELEKLKPLPGWEDWYKGKKLRRKLDYNSD